MITVSITNGVKCAERVFNPSSNKNDKKEVPQAETSVAIFILFHCSGNYFLFQP